MQVIAGTEWPRCNTWSCRAISITDRGAEAFFDVPFWRSSQCEVSLSGTYGGNPTSDEMKAKLAETFGERFRA